MASVLLGIYLKDLAVLLYFPLSHVTALSSWLQLQIIRLNHTNAPSCMRTLGNRAVLCAGRYGAVLCTGRYGAVAPVQDIH